jgi:hypothetical protein
MKCHGCLVNKASLSIPLDFYVKIYINENTQVLSSSVIGLQSRADGCQHLIAAEDENKK